MTPGRNRPVTCAAQDDRAAMVPQPDQVVVVDATRFRIFGTDARHQVIVLADLDAMFADVAEEAAFVVTP
jgi:hypothetical protein